MRYLSKLSLLAALGVILFGMPSAANAQTISTCDRALGEAYLDVNNVRARILNTGGLFYRGEPHVYEVPKGSGSNAIFASGIWIAGQVGGQLRASATRYGEWEMWAGPLDDQGNPPTDCAVYDRIYKVNRTDVEALDLSGTTTPDMVDWPTGLGAPTMDANGDVIEILDEPFASRVDRKINLGAGERPVILGDQTIWWVMNDRGNQHTSTDAPPIGLEVHGTAFAFDVAGDIGNATFYKFNLFYKGNVPLEESYLSIWSDPDLGNFDDDYVGSDTSLGLGYVYNSDNVDEGGEGYGTPAPAAGYDFFQGPIVPSVATDTAYVSGKPVPGFKNLAMTTYAFFNNDGGVQGGPGDAEGYYNYMKGNWLDGKRFTFGGSGRDFSEEPTNFMFTGDPAVQGCWTEVNSDCLGTSISPGDRRFAMSTGPFTINPGDQQEIVFGLVFGKGEDNWDSVNALRTADALAQAAFDVNFELPSSPARPIVNVVPGDGNVAIEWTNAVNSNNYLETYNEYDPFAPLDDPDYNFEGYKVIQYSEASDQVGATIATYDVANGITKVIDGFPGQPTSVTASGTDSGVRHAHLIGGLTNTKTYYYGVQAYAYNEGSSPKVFNGPVERFEVIPRRSENIVSPLAIEAALNSATPDFVAEADAVGQGVVTADVKSPGSILEGAVYTTTMYEMELTGKKGALATNGDGPQMDDYPVRLDGTRTDASDYAKNGAATAVTYDIDRDYMAQTTKVFNGNIDGEPAPLRKDVILIDGLQFSVTGPAPGMIGFKMIANAGGPLDPPDMAAFAFNSWGFPTVEGRDRPESGRSQSTNGSTWGIAVGGGSGPYGDEAGPFNTGSTWVGRSIREGSESNPWPNVGSDDYEWRFTDLCADNADGTVTDGGCVGWRGFGDGALVGLPFQLWNTGTTSDPSDDYRLLPLICESECDGNGADDIFDIDGDHPTSGGDNDPYSDWIYWYKPADNGAAPGEQGYLDFFFGAASNGDRVFSRQVLMNWNGGSPGTVYDADMVEPGTVIQYNTKKPNQPGDTFTINTTGYGTTAPSDSLKKSRLADINVVPNPYMGASDYERSQLVDEVRFSNMPLTEAATLRVFTLSGTLINTLTKPAGTNQLSWNLTTANNLPIGSGIYLIHVDVDGVGTHVVKFAAIKKRIQLNVF